MGTESLMYICGSFVIHSLQLIYHCSNFTDKLNTVHSQYNY